MKKTKKLKADARYIRPRSANERMRGAKNIYQTVYICGATGYGKTSLVADFFARRNYEYYSMAECSVAEMIRLHEETKRLADMKKVEGVRTGNTENMRAENGESARGKFTETIRTKSVQTAEKHPHKSHLAHIVIVDDLHEICTSEDRSEAYRFFEELTEDRDVWLLLISRAAIPAWLKPLYIRRIFVMIGEEELRLAENEQEDYLKKWDLSLTPETEEYLLEHSGGHPLFLRIVALRLSSLGEGESRAERGHMERAAIKTANEDLCDYLEIHVYDQWELELQEFLMDMSIVDRFNLQTAQFITKRSDVRQLVRRAQETGTFLQTISGGEDSVYEMRNAMRISMRRRLYNRCSRTHIDNLYRSAGSSLELQGRIPEALAMYEKCDNEDGISRLLIQNARKHAGSGNYWELRDYYLALSEATILQSPELMTGMSLLQSILMNDEESERWYVALSEYIRTETGSAKRAAQARRLSLDIALPQRGTGNMTELLKRAWTFVTERRTILPELSLTNNEPSLMNGGKDFSEWSRHDREMAKGIGRIVEMLMGGFGKGLVNLALAESFFEKGGDYYEVSMLAQKGRMQALAGGKPEMVFVAAGLLGWLSIFNNCVDDAQETIASFRAGIPADMQQLLRGIDALRVRFLLYVGRSAEVAGWLKDAPDEDAEFCTLERYRYITKVRVYLSTGQRERARSLLERLSYYAKKRQRTYLQIETQVLLAITQYRLGEGDWRETLQSAVSQAEDYHFVRVLTREGSALWELLRQTDYAWKDTAFRKQVMEECRQMAQLYPVYLNEKQGGNISLSEKALKILRLQADGWKTEEIARVMKMSSSGIKYHSRETYKKLGVSSKAAAISEARNLHIL